MNPHSLSQKLKSAPPPHTHTSNFQCLVYKMSISKYLETSRNIWKY